MGRKKKEESKEIQYDPLVPDVDKFSRRYTEWAKIYHFQLIERNDDVCSEYEWAWNVVHSLKYRFLPDMHNHKYDYDTYDQAAEKELRAINMVRDMLMMADPGEKLLLTEENALFRETTWVKKMLKV